jgi:hypothetical protein
VDFKAELVLRMGKVLIKKLLEVQVGELSIPCKLDRCGPHDYSVFSPENLSRVHKHGINDNCKSVVHYFLGA